MDSDEAAGRIAEFIKGIPIIDTHEHIIPQQAILEKDVDLFELMGNGVTEYGEYIVLDLISSGMPLPKWNEKISPTDRWKHIERYITRIHNTSVYRSFVVALQDLCDLPYTEITSATWPDFSACLKKANRRQDWYNYVLKEKGNIEVAFLDNWWNVTDFDVDRELFRPVLRINSFLKYEQRGMLIVTDENDPKNIAKKMNHKLTDFYSYLSLIDLVFQRAVDSDVACIKSSTAYDRSLCFVETPLDKAAQIYETDRNIGVEEKKQFGDFITHYCIKKAIEYDLPIQIHTGMQATCKSLLKDSNPLKLQNLFPQYREAKFILLHGGFPFTNEAGVLAKTFPNVYLDFSWLPLLSKQAAKNTLSEWLDLIPASKLVWGGDCGRVETAYGSLIFAKEVVVEVLAEKVYEGTFGMDVACHIAGSIFNGNASSLFSDHREK
jgi:hypothetical protein